MRKVYPFAGYDEQADMSRHNTKIGQSKNELLLMRPQEQSAYDFLHTYICTKVSFCLCQTPGPVDE
jgi:hypothetical protein